MVIEKEDVGQRLAEELRNDTFQPESVRSFQEEVIRRLRPTGRFKKQEAEEIAIIALEEAYQAIDTFRGDSGFFTWAMTIARRVAFDYYRQVHRVALEPTDLWLDSRVPQVDEVQDVQGINPVPEDPAYQATDAEEAQLRKWACEDALKSLSDDQRFIVTLRIYREYSFPEIADMIGSNAKAVQHRFTRTIIPKLRQHFIKNGLMPG